MLPKIEFKVCGQGNNPTTYKECEAFIEKWQKILRIQDWDIGLKFLSGIETHKSLGSDEYNAFCSRESCNKTATISINTESPQINDELDLSIIHELLHIVFNEYQTVVEFAVEGEYARNVIKLKMEQTVESLAKSLMEIFKSN